MDNKTLEPKVYTKPTTQQMNTWLLTHRAGFDATDTKSIVFAIGGKIEIYVKEPGQTWDEAKLHAFGYKDFDMLKKYNDLP